MIKPRSLPALRHFAFFDDYDEFTPWECDIFSSLAPQLSSMTFVLSLLPTLPSVVRSQTSLSLLFDCHLANSDFFKRCANNVTHLRIYHGSTLGPCVGDVQSAAKSWISWAAIFEAKKTITPLRLLYLPKSRAPTEEEEEEGEEEESVKESKTQISHLVDNLVQICRRRDIEVVFEDQPSSWEVTQISKDFTRRSEARRRAFEAGNKEGNA